jgi:precorrin-3B C17-methyltransferase
MSSGRLDIVGLGPGAPEHRTAAATAAVQRADAVIGYGPYVEQCLDLLDESRQTVVRWRMGEERERAADAVARAQAGERVALVCSGDPGVYGMAARTLELLAELDPGERPAVDVVPGVTVALAGAALVGAPLADDFAVLSLSDLHQDWATIERRVSALAASGLALCLYNPRSKSRHWQLERVLELLRTQRGEDTPVAVLSDVARAGQSAVLTTLAGVDVAAVGMRTLLIVAGESARAAGGWLVAERRPAEVLR